MSFRKFGTSDDQRVALDREEDELLRRTSAADAREGAWTAQDAAELAQENTE